MNGHVEQQQGTSTQESEFDIWDFMTCAKCNLPFASDGVNQPSVPFWLTNCGHVICNSHLNADQSCPSCNAPGAELMPLQKDLPAPMSDWFSHIPFRLDALAQATRIQLETLAASLQFYKGKCAQYRSILEKCKAEVMAVKSLRKEVEALRNENEQLRSGRGAPQLRRGEVLNSNGKRLRENHSNGSFSSPRSINTPLGPPRITLPPDQEPPQLLAGSRPRPAENSTQPPGSSRFTEQYAYNPPQSAHMSLQHQQLLSHAQKAPTKFLPRDQRAMPPPPTPSHAQQSRQVFGSYHPGPPRMATPMDAYPSGQAPELHPQAVPRQQTGGSGTFQSRMTINSSSYTSADSASRLPGGDGRRFVPPTLIATGSAVSNRFPSSGPSSSTPSNFEHAPGQTRRFVPAKQGNTSANVYGGVAGDSGGGINQQRLAQRQRTAFVPSSRAGFS